MPAPYSLSILIPCYNAQSHLTETLSSVLEAVGDEAEVICYDDGSTDGTVQLLQGIAASNPRVKILIGGENKGVGAARNALIDASTGTYLWFIDSDDLLIEGTYPKIRGLLKQLEPGVVSFNFRSFGQRSENSKGRERHRTSFTGPPETLSFDRVQNYIGTLRSNNWHPWARILHRSVYDATMRFHGTHFEDAELIPILVHRAHSHYHLDETVIAYRQHAGSLLGTMTAERNIGCLDALGQQRAKLEAALGALPDQMRDAHAAACARVLRFVMRDIERAGGPQVTALHAKAHAAFTQAHGLPRGELFKRVRRSQGLMGAIHMLKRDFKGRRASKAVRP